MTIINAMIYTMEGEPIKCGFVQVKDGKIAQVGGMDEFTGDDEVYDAAGCVVTPGLVDAHTHLGLFEDGLSFEGEDGNEDTDPATPHLRVLDAINTFDRSFDEALAAGVTAAVSAPGSANPIGGQCALMKTAGKRIDRMIIKEPLAMKMALGENPKITYNGKNQTPVTRMATASIIRENLLKARDYYEAKQRIAADEEDEDDIEFDFKCESLIPVIKGEMPVHFHVHRADDIHTAMRIAKEFHLRYVLIHATEAVKVLEDLLEEQVPVVIGPVMTDRCKPELREQRLDTAGILSKAGVQVALCTDHPETPLKFFGICGGLCEKYGMAHDDVLAAMTINPAKICGADKRIGSIKVGKDADIAVFDGDPLVLATRVKMVMVNGAIAYQAER